MVPELARYGDSNRLFNVDALTPGNIEASLELPKLCQGALHSKENERREDLPEPAAWKGGKGDGTTSATGLEGPLTQD